MAEEQELRLSVTLDDKASEQLEKLLGTMQQITAAGSSTSSGMSAFTKSLQEAGKHAEGVHSSLAGMAAKGGFIGGIFFEIGRQVHSMATEFASAVLNVKAYADAIVNLDNAASRAATSAAQFQRNIATMRESGISAETAAKNVQGFSDAIADLQHDFSKVRSTLLAGLRGAELQQTQEFLDRITHMDKQRAYNEMVRFSREVVRRSWDAMGQFEAGSLAQREFGKVFGVEDIDRMRDELQNVTPELEKLWAARSNNAQRYQTAVEKQGDAWERAIKSVQATAFNVLPLNESMEGFGELVKGITEMLERWEKLIGDAGDELKPPPGGGQEPDYGPKPGTFDERWGDMPRGPGQAAPVPTAPPGPRTWRPGQEGVRQPPRNWGEWWNKGTTWDEFFDWLNPWSEARPKWGPEDKVRQGEKPWNMDPQTGKLKLFSDAGGDAAATAGGSERFAAVSANTNEMEGLTQEFKRLADYFEMVSFETGGKVGLLGAPGGGGLGGRGGAPGTPGGGIGSVPPMGAGGTPGGGTPGGGTPGGGTPGTGDGAGGGIYPPGTHGGPGGPPITPQAPGGTVPATLPGSQAPLSYPGGTFTKVPSLETYTGEKPAGAGGTTEQLKTGANGRVDPNELYKYLVGKYQSSSLNGYVPPDGAKFGIKKGTPEEWATLGVAIAKQESGFNPRSYNPNDPGGSVGIFQFGQGQTAYTGGRDQRDPQASADALVKSQEKLILGSGRNQYGEQGTLGKMGITFGSIRRPWETTQHLPYARGVAAKNVRDPVAAPTAVTTLKTTPSTGEGPGSLLTPERMTPATTLSATSTKGGEVRLDESSAHGYKRGNVQTEAWLVDTVRQATRALPPGYTAKVISTVDARATGTPWHPSGRAIDITIYDPNGHAIPNVGNRGVPGYELYERMALAARQYAAKSYPQQTFTWGGHFHSGTPFDRMHFQSGGISAEGFTKQQLATPVLQDQQPSSQVAGPGAGSGQPPSPRIEILKTRPAGLDGEKPDEELDVAAGKRRSKPIILPEKQDEELDVAAGKRRYRRDEELDRAAGKGKLLDRATTRKVDVNGTGTVNVKVKAESKTDISPDLYKPTPIARQTQMEPAKKGPETSAEKHTSE